MNGVRFDTLARVLGSVVDRRATARAIAGGAFGALGLVAGHDPQAKKKKRKKCKKPMVKCGKKCCAKGQKCLAGQCAVACTFTKTPTLWTVEATCATTSTIEIPDGVTLDGDGKTIRLAGSKGRIVNQPGAAEVKIQNLTIDGAGQSRARDPGVEIPIRLSTSAGGEIKDVTIANIGCVPAIIAGGPGTPNRDIIDCTFSNAEVGGDGAISLVAPMDATISNCSFSGIAQGFGVRAAFGSITVSIVDSTFEDVLGGVLVAEASDFTVTGNQMQGVTAGFVTGDAGANNMVVTNNTIVGPGSSGGTGVLYGDNATGNATGNTISNFLGAESCGIEIDAAAAAVTIGANTFPDPPGNEQNVRDNRP